MEGIFPGKSSLDASVTMVGRAVLPWGHADNLTVLQFRFEAATDPAIGTGGQNAMIRLALIYDIFFQQAVRGAGRHASPAGHAIAGQEILRHPGGNLAVKAAPFDGQGKGPLYFFAGPYAAGAENTFGRVKLKVGIAVVNDGFQVIMTV